MNSDRSIDFEPISSRRRLFSEIAYPADYLPGAIAVLDDVAQDFPELVRINHLGVEEAQRGLRVGDDGADWLLHFMSDRGGQFAQRRHARHACELHLPPAASFPSCRRSCLLYSSNVTSRGSTLLTR
jgi:hypothetical protein